MLFRPGKFQAVTEDLTSGHHPFLDTKDFNIRKAFADTTPGPTFPTADMLEHESKKKTAEELCKGVNLSFVFLIRVYVYKSVYTSIPCSYTWNPQKSW